MPLLLDWVSDCGVGDGLAEVRGVGIGADGPSSSAGGGPSKCIGTARPIDFGLGGTEDGVASMLVSLEAPGRSRRMTETGLRGAGCDRPSLIALLPRGSTADSVVIDRPRRTT